MKKTIYLLLFLSSNSFLFSQTWNDTLAQIDKIMARYKPTNPGCQLAISRNGTIIYSKAWGMADLEHVAPLTTNSILEAGSVSKQFTAAAILLLEQQGKLSLNDDIRKYIPELPDYGTPILLRQMMQHTSGFKDWGSIVSIAGWPRSTKTYDNEDALHVIKHQKTLNNKPGAEYIYSNSNYNLLALVVDRVTGKTMAEFTKESLFQPAGMTHTEWRNDYKKIVPNRAIAYGKVATTYYTNMPNENVYGNGGLLTTAEDLLAWNKYFLNGKLGNPSLLPKQTALYKLSNGLKNTYGAGLVVDSTRGWKTISHGGATASYRANLEHFTDLDLSFAFLSNTSEFDQFSNASEEIRNLFVKDVTPSAPKSIITYTMPAEVMKQYAGWYRNTRSGGGVNFTIKDGKLSSTFGNITPTALDEFAIGSNKIKMMPGKPARMILITATDSIELVAAPTASGDKNGIEAYIGEYYSAETESRFSIISKNGNLFLRREPNYEVQLFPTFEDGFNYMGSTIWFQRDSKKTIAGFYVTVSRARMVEFVKTPGGK
ncbi:MAG: serine hydrolase [Chitinophagaceae bacterium]|nr:serine hydrolase [Chitinophagaceae bacterium]